MAIMDEKKLGEIINKWIGSKKHKMMVDGENYYMTENDIKKREFHYWSRNKRIVDDERANIKIANNFFKTITDQKVSYCLGKDVVVSDFEPSFDINEEIYYTAEAASQKSIGWCFIYVDNFGVLKQKTMESENIIDIYDGTIEQNLEILIRLYCLDGVKYAEVWNSELKEIYEYQDNVYNLIESTTHLDGISWGKIPFVKLENNRYGYSDLSPIKSLIDAYDIIISDFANNFVDFQEVILMIKNYAENVKTEDAAAEFMEFLKKHKVINVKDNGDVEIISKEVPHQARKEFLEILKKNIFLFSQAVDIDDFAGNNLTNVNILARYSMLDQKANKFLRECKKFVYGLLEFSNLYNEIINNRKQVQAIANAKITFNKSQLINETETIENCIKQVGQGIASIETIVAKNPWVDDLETELEKINNEDFNDTGGDLE